MAIKKLDSTEYQWAVREEVGRKELAQPCPNCGRKLVLRHSKYGFFYGCRGWPECDVLIGCHGNTTEPLGIPAEAATRQARIRAHSVFDLLWKDKWMTRTEAYAWLAQALDCPVEQAHIGHLNRLDCERVTEMVSAKLVELKAVGA